MDPCRLAKTTLIQQSIVSNLRTWQVFVTIITSEKGRGVTCSQHYMLASSLPPIFRQKGSEGFTFCYHS